MCVQDVIIVQNYEICFVILDKILQKLNVAFTVRIDRKKYSKIKDTRP